jgi:hypothetical protein
VESEQLTVQETATHYWVVQSGAVDVSGALTRQAAEAECELLSRLRDRSVRRARLRDPEPRQLDLERS